MGWSFKSLEIILERKELFENKKVLTLGTLYPFVSDKEIYLLNQMGINTNVSKNEFTRDLFCKTLNAECCHYLDVSDYQGSEVICNLNYPIPDNLEEQYDVIIDAGTLEHVSNMSSGILNYFKILKTNGILYFGNPSNNWINHGFFQFSPTFYQDLCIDNKNLELKELFIKTSNDDCYYDILNYPLNPYIINTINSSSDKLNVHGIIKKLGDEISLDLVQTKYRSLYEESDTSSFDSIKPVREGQLYFFKKVFIDIFWWLFAIPIIPIRYKFSLLKNLYKLKKKLNF